MILFPAVFLYECVEKASYLSRFFHLVKFSLQPSSAIPSWCYTGVLLVGEISTYHPAGTQQENPERVGS